MKILKNGKIILLFLIVLSLFYFNLENSENVDAKDNTFWVGVERQGKNSHQPEGPWCPEGAFLVAFDLDRRGNYSPHDSPVVGQAMCAIAKGPNDRWGFKTWVGIEKAGKNSHQAIRWCPQGTFLVAFDLDGPRNYSAHDSPVVGQALCASLAGSKRNGSSKCFWVGVENAGKSSHQPGKRWCPEGSFLVSFDLDGPRNLSPYDSPVVGQAMCCTLPE